MTHLQNLLKKLHNNFIYIQTHNYPDPDALAAAAGLQALLMHYHIKSTICYKGQIEKANTLAMLELLNISISSEAEISLKPTDEIILVDCQKGNANVNDFTGNEVGCIDHHKLQKTDYYQYFDIRPEIGSCASIIASYFQEENIPMSSLLATTLMYGIQTDTASLTRGVSQLDIDMFSYLFHQADQGILHRIASSSLTRKDLFSYDNAIRNLEIHDSFGYTNAGDDCPEAIIGTLSDFILTIDEIRLSLVYSRRAGGIKFSIRSESGLYDSANIIKSALTGFGSGGGHAEMAAGFVPDIDTQKEADKIIEFVIDRIKKITQKA